MVTTRRMTVEELWALGEDGGDFELIEGEPVPMIPPGGLHATIVANLSIEIGLFARSAATGRVFAGDVGIILHRDPDTVLAPDVAYVRHERMSETPVGYLELAPDLAVEVISPTNTVAEISRKIRIYLDAGARQVWIVYPQHRRVIIHRPGTSPQSYEHGDEIDGGDVLPGFRLLVSRIFD